MAEAKILSQEEESDETSNVAILLDAAYQYLNSPAGKKFLESLGSTADIESTQKQISKLEKDLSREDKKDLREERRETRRGVRIQKREDRKEKRKKEIRQLRAQLKSNIPVLKQYKVKGRLFDKNTGNPLEGVKIKALEAIVYKGGKEGRQALRDQKQLTREERQNIREDFRSNSEELQKLREEARKESQKQRQYNQETRKLNRELTQQEIDKRGKQISQGKNEGDFDKPTSAYFGGLLNNEGDENPKYYGYYSSIQLKKAKTELDKYLSEKKEKIAKTQISKYTTDKNGYFEAIISIVVLPSVVEIKTKDEETGEKITESVEIRSNDISILKPKLLYTTQGYVPAIQELLNLDNTIKSDLKTVSLINIDEEAERVKNEINNEIDKQIEKANILFLDGVELVIRARRKNIMKVVNIIKTRLIPLAVGLLIVFGITKLSQKNQKTCPSSEDLKLAVRRRNRVVKQLNQIFKALTFNSAIAAAFYAIGAAFKSVRISIDSLPIPLATQPYTVVSKLQNINDLLERLEQENKDLSKQTLIALIFLVASLVIILLLLKGIDKLIEECAQENLELEAINQELLDLTQEAEEEGNPKTTNVNGFTLSVEYDKNEVGDIKRKFAVAKDSKGVTILKGEPSFSSSDQILIDELVFYIQSNNLKAY